MGVVRVTSVQVGPFTASCWGWVRRWGFKVKFHGFESRDAAGLPPAYRHDGPPLHRAGGRHGSATAMPEPAAAPARTTERGAIDGNAAAPDALPGCRERGRSRAQT
jgi:hypothetical protein